jgi:rubrerythrin
MGSWTLDDIPWDRFDRSKVDPEILRIVKAASLVEQNGGDYAVYLCNVFADDADFRAAARSWGEEEIQHGQALGRWAMLADPAFDHAAASARFTEGFRVPLDAASSVRGSRAGELVARCIVETGTSSYYTALAEAAREPVLKEICQRIAADELRHYKLFYTNLRRYLAAERIGFWGRLKVALGRIAESEDDELAYAYHAANENAAPYDRRRSANAYARRAYAVYRRHHVERGLAMVFKAVGLKPHGRLNLIVARLAWWGMQRRVQRLARAAA